MAWRQGRGGRAAGKTSWLLLLGGALLLPACSSPSFPELDEEPEHHASVTEKETRFFTISVDGKKAGQYRMAITHQPDGTLHMTGKAKVRVSYVIYTYTYSFEGTETYQQGRLVRFQSHANDNGKKLEVTGKTEGDRLHLQANGKKRATTPEAWVTSYWQLPACLARGEKVVLLDGDTGRVFSGTLRHVEDKPLEVAGSPQPCRHYRVTGGPSSPVDLWYDGQGRLVREEFVEEGHRTVLLMTRAIHRKLPQGK